MIYSPRLPLCDSTGQEKLIIRTKIIMSTSYHIRKWVENEIISNECVLFSKTYCPYSTVAKTRLVGMFNNIIIHELDKRSDGDQIQYHLPINTVPCIFINGKCIGGLLNLNRNLTLESKTIN
jgi:glutaredoxin 3